MRSANDDYAGRRQSQLWTHFKMVMGLRVTLTRPSQDTELLAVLAWPERCVVHKPSRSSGGDAQCWSSGNLTLSCPCLEFAAVLSDKRLPHLHNFAVRLVHEPRSVRRSFKWKVLTTRRMHWKELPLFYCISQHVGSPCRK